MANDRGGGDNFTTREEIIIKKEEKEVTTPIKKKKVTVNLLNIYNSKGELLNTFLENKNKKQLRDIDKSIEKVTDQTASRESIRRYFQERAEKEGEVYTPKSEKEFKEEKKEFRKKHDNEEFIKSQKVFQNGNSLTFSNKNLIKKFNFMYIQVKVKIYFDGYYVISSQRGDIYHTRIKQRTITKEINKAIRRALAPYGSDLNFELLEWNYVFHRSPIMQ